MLIGLFIGLSFLALIVLLAWSTLGSGWKKKNIAFAIVLLLVASWTLVLKPGVSHPIGLAGAYLGLLVSLAALFVPFHTHMKKNPDKFPKDTTTEIER